MVYSCRQCGVLVTHALRLVKMRHLGPWKIRLWLDKLKYILEGSEVSFSYVLRVANSVPYSLA